MSVAPAPPPTLRSAPPTSGAPPGAPPDDPLFQSVLADHWARTAIAEGQDHSHAQRASRGTKPGEQADRLTSGAPDAAGQPALAAPVDGLLGVLTPGTNVSAPSIAGPSTGMPTAEKLTPALVGARGDLPPGAGPVAGATDSGAFAEDGGPTDRGLATTPAPTALATVAPLPPASGPQPNVGGLDSSSQSRAPLPGQAQPSMATSSDGPVAQTGNTPRLLADAPSQAREKAAAPAGTAGASMTVPPPSEADDRSPSPVEASAEAGAATTASKVTAAQALGDLTGLPSSTRGGARAAFSHATLSQPALSDNAASHGGSAVDGQSEDARPRAGVASQTAVQGGPVATVGASVQAPAGSIAQLGGGSPSGFTAAAPPAGSPSQSTPAGVDMQRMVDTVHATVELAIRQGGSQARIALQPEELGGIRVHLSQTAEGLLARLVPETPAGAQALADGHTELHRSLSSLGVPLLRMDIGFHDQPDARPREDRFPSGTGPGRAAAMSEEGEEPDGDVELDRARRVPEPADGGLVNVLA